MKTVVITILVLVVLVAGASIAYAQSDEVAEGRVCNGDGYGCEVGEDCENNIEGEFCFESDSQRGCGRSGGGCRR